MWNDSFPEDPTIEPGKYFNRLTVFSLSTYCYFRKILPTKCFTYRKIDGKSFVVFKRDAAGSKQIFEAITQISKAFIDRQVLEARLAVFDSSGAILESFKLSYNYQAGSSASAGSNTTVVGVEEVKTAFFNEMESIRQVCASITPLDVDDYPIKFRFVVGVFKEQEMPDIYGLPKDSVPDISIGNFRKDDVATFELNNSEYCKVGIETKKMSAQDRLTLSDNILNMTLNSSVA